MKYSAKDSSVDDVIRGVVSMDEAYDDYVRARTMYDGDPKEIFGSRKLARELEKTCQGYPFRLSKTPVEIMSDRVKLSAITAENGEEYIEQIRSANQMALWEPESIKSTFIYGDTYILAVPVNPDDEDESPEVRAAGVRITKLDTLSTRAVYDDLAQDAVFVVRSSFVGDGKQKQRQIEVCYPDGVAVWISNPNVRDYSKPSNWNQFISDETPDGWYAYPFTGNQIPIFHLVGQHFTDSAYGKPEHYDAFGPQNAINKALATMISATDAMGFPLRYKIARQDDSQYSSPADPFDTNESSVPAVGVRTAGQVAEPGTILDDPNAETYGQFNPADPQNFIVQIDKYTEIMSQVTSTPLYAFNPGGDQPSGTARQMADAPLKSKVENRELLLGSTFAKLYRFVLALKGVAVSTVNVKWKNAGIAIDADTWDVIQKKQESGVPVAVSLREAGYEDSEITEWLNSDTEELTLRQRLDLAAKAAETLSKLKDVLTPDQLEAVINGLLGDLVTVPAREETETLSVEGEA